MNAPIRFVPVYAPRIWGGRSLETVLNRTLPLADESYGESWEISDRPEAMSIVEGGAWHGATLHDLWEQHREKLFGPGYGHLDRFPILAKILAPEQTLSVQVHPTPESLKQYPGEEKNECWYFAGNASAPSELYAGFLPGTALPELVEAMAQGTVSTRLQRLEAKAGDSIFIPSGLVHALGAPGLVYEIQQNADTTYRLDDWGRTDKHGTPRELHREQALACMQSEIAAPGLRRAGSPAPIADTPWFRVVETTLAPGEAYLPGDPSRFAILTVAQGTLSCGGQTFRRGDFLLLPAHAAPCTAGEHGATLLITTVPPTCP